MKKQVLTKEDVFELFKQDMERGPKLALYSSFTRYAKLRDQLIKEYSEISKISEEEFHHVLAMELIVW